MSSENILNLQRQILDNSEDVNSYLLELRNWEEEMKKKEEELKLIQTTEQEVPPVRNTLYRPKKKGKHKKKEKPPIINQSKQTDYKAWEEFDAEKEMEKVDEETKQSSDSNDSEDEFSVQKRKQLAILHKDKGNTFFKKRNYDSAINSYTTGIQLDPENPLIPANRAMAFLKKEQYQAAENDCSLCLAIDSTYVKAYFRRGTARTKLNKLSLAKADFIRVLELDPDNKEAQLELEKLSEVSIDTEGSENEEEVVTAQKVWSQFLGNESVKYTEDAPEENSLPCIFSDAISISPSDSSMIGIDQDMIEIKISNMDVGDFSKKVENSELLHKSIIKESQMVIVDDSPTSFKLSLPLVPTSSFQFLADWNTIESNPDIQYQYLKQFPPEQLPVVFKNYMEPEIFSGILKILSTSFLENGDDVYDYLKYLSEVGRFKTMVMFLSDQEQSALEKLLQSIKSLSREKTEISDILQRYKC